MPRVYTRKFDWDEARKLRESGLSYSKIAAQLGVTYNAVRFACDEQARKAQLERFSRWQANGRCRECGGRCSRYYLNGVRVHRCRDCFNKERATSVRPGELQCGRCREWMPDDAFPLNRAGKKQRRGRHSNCRACITILKREWRAKNVGRDRAYDRERKRRERQAA